jgi:hypothetical protein
MPSGFELVLQWVHECGSAPVAAGSCRFRDHGAASPPTPACLTCLLGLPTPAGR